MKHFISTLIKKFPIEKQPYFSSLLNHTMNKDQFIKSQISVLDAVQFFSRPMFLISSKLNTYEQRMVILKNIFDEHGNGEIKNAHGNTYKNYLIALGATEKDLKMRKKQNAVIKFNETLMKCAKHESIMTSIAMMGIIESRYSKISSIIVQTILDNEWIKEENLSHYSTHKDLDVEHAQDFFDIIRNGWKNSDSKEKIKKGLLLGNSTILDLYNNLL